MGPNSTCTWYQKILEDCSVMLDKNSDIIRYVHSDFLSLGSSTGSTACFSSEQIFRSICVKGLFGLSFRNTSIRIGTDYLLRKFTKLFDGPVIDYPFLCKANKCISPETWEKINSVFQNFTIDENLISGDSLRVDSTVVEANVHHPSDSHLLWDSFGTLYCLFRKMYDFMEVPTVKRSKRLFTTYLATPANNQNQ